VFEAVPLLVLATADGAVRVEQLLRKIATDRPRAWTSAFMLASSIVAALAFVPVVGRAAHRAGVVRNKVYAALAERGATRALVFADKLVHLDRHATWALFPPNPSPTLDDDLVFVRVPLGPGGARAGYAFWRARFSDRRAFVFADLLDHRVLQELDPAVPPPASASFDGLVKPASAGQAAVAPP